MPFKNATKCLPRRGMVCVALFLHFVVHFVPHLVGYASSVTLSRAASVPVIVNRLFPFPVDENGDDYGLRSALRA